MRQIITSGSTARLIYGQRLSKRTNRARIRFFVVPHRMPSIPALGPQIEHANGPRPYLENHLVFWHCVP